MKNSKLFKLISFVLVFLITGISVFLGTQSFAKYVDQFNQSQSAGIASPVISVENGRLSRISDTGQRFVYDNSNFSDGSMNFYDLKPSDVIECFFSVNNFEGSRLNEVKMKVTLAVRIFLRRLTKDGEIDEYYVVGNTFLVSDDGADQEDMDGSNFSFYYSNNDSLTNNEGDYISIPLDKNEDKTDSLSSFISNSENYNGRTLKYSGNTSVGYDHYLGFIFEPGQQATEKAFLAKVTLPAQNATNKEYVSARLFINVSVHCEQMQ